MNYNSTRFTRTKNYYEAVHNNVNNTASPEMAFARCGCCTVDTSYPVITKENGQPVWSQKDYSFLKDNYSPEPGNDENGNLRIYPTLWNNGSGNLLSGVFEVLKNRIYQVRGYDMANITFVKTGSDRSDTINEKSRWIVLDTLMSTECTKAALDCFEKYLKTILNSCSFTLKGKISGMIISHSHIDHYGGMSVVKEYFAENIDVDDIPGTQNVKHPFILAPSGFFEHSVSENVYVGNAMGRRASYQYGSFIKPQYSDFPAEINKYTAGSISIGIGQGQSTGLTSLLEPTLEISDTALPYNLDGLTVDFQLTPGTEAPAEMNNYFRDYNALWLAENCVGTLHNLYTLRGAQIRDGKTWAGYLMETAFLYGKKSHVIFQSHNWPHWSKDIIDDCKSIPDECKVDIEQFLIDTASIYKYINDQTLLYMNMGYKMNEASDMLTIPRKMQKNWSTKPFYGTPKHNSKAVYQKYLGWYDANPLHLEELPPEQFASELLRYIGCDSEEKIIEKATTDYKNGNYWMSAYMTDQIIIGSKNNENITKAKEVCANALQQLGYQSESGTWRNVYLSAAYELSNPKNRNTAVSGGAIASLTTEMLLDYISIFFDGDRGSYGVENAAENSKERFFYFNGFLLIKDKDNNITERFRFVVKNGTILYYGLKENASLPNGYETITVLRDELIQIITQNYNGTYKLLSRIQKCMVNVKNDRFRFFDIIGRHDSNVLIGDKYYDLKKEANDCILMLEKYTDVFKNENTTEHLTSDDKSKWDQYLKILKTETHVILDGEFFDPLNPNSGIGVDSSFYEHELFYTLYSLYHYLFSPYLKNDFGFSNKSLDEEAYVKLKKKISLLEGYVADCYLRPCGSQSEYVYFDKDDAAAYSYLTDKSIDCNSFKLSFAELFKELSFSYKELKTELEN